MGQYTIKDIESRAEVLKNNVDNIYRALNTKIKSSPEKLDQVPEWILNIPGLPTEEPLTITPSVDRQEYFSSDETKHNPITVEPVTSAIDSNIQPENIKVGISILGVNGTCPGGGNAKPEEAFDVQPTTADQTITPREGYAFSGGTVHAVTADIDKNIQSENIKEGVSILGVAGTFSGGGNAKPEEVFDVQPTTTDQTITPTEGSVFSGGTVHAVTSSIDGNIVAGNIKEGVTILGVAGTLKEEKPEETFNVQPTTAEQTITPTAGSVFSGGTVHAVTSSIDSNIQPENIKQGVSILGVAGTLSGGSGASDYHYMNGTVDKEGLRAIGWTDEDILTYEQNSPHYTWQNDLYTVSDENKALYNLDDPNPKSYKNNPNITFVPKKNMESYFTKISIWGGGFVGMQYIKGIPLYDTSNMTTMGRLFDGCFSLTSIPQLNTSNVTDMYQMFFGCSGLTSIPLLNTSNVTDMNSMFNGCSGLTSIPQLNTSNVTDMHEMFNNCSNLTTIPLLDTSKVTNMNQMFNGCSNLTSIPQLNTSNVTDMNRMFQNCSNLTTIPLLDTSKVTDMYQMFNGCSNLTSIPQLNTSNVTKMDYIFQGCSSLTTVEGIDFSGLTLNNLALFGLTEMPNLTRFIVNGKINVSISGDYSIKALTAIDYDSVKSILAAADRTDNTNAKTLAFNRTMTDQNGELAALVASCTSKGWTISGLTLQ